MKKYHWLGIRIFLNGLFTTASQLLPPTMVIHSGVWLAVCVYVCVRALLHVWMWGKHTYIHTIPKPWRQSRYTCKPWFASIVLVKCFPTTGMYVIVIFPYHTLLLYFIFKGCAGGSLVGKLEGY